MEKHSLCCVLPAGLGGDEIPVTYSAPHRVNHEQCLALPIAWVHESPPLLKRAAERKARYPLSLADAWIAASAMEEQAVLIHKDPEFAPVPVEQEALPFKVAGSENG